MKKKLSRIEKSLYHFKNEKKVIGKTDGMSGDCSGLSGNLDSCELTKQDRKKGLALSDLVGESR